MKHYSFSVSKKASKRVPSRHACAWEDLSLVEAIALFSATDALDALLIVHDDAGHSIRLVKRIDGLDMLCSEYRSCPYWKTDPVLHLYIVPLLVDTLDLRLEYDKEGIQGIVFDRFFYLTSGKQIEDSCVSAYMNLDIPAVQDKNVDWLVRALVKTMSVKLGHDLHGLCIVQHMGSDYAFRVYGDQITPCNVLKPIDKLTKEGIL